MEARSGSLVNARREALTAVCAPRPFGTQSQRGLSARGFAATGNPTSRSLLESSRLPGMAGMRAVLEPVALRAAAPRLTLAHLVPIELAIVE